MKKLSVLLCSLLIACGGGASDSTPEVDYSMYNGTYLCKKSDDATIAAYVQARVTSVALTLTAYGTSFSYTESIALDIPRWSRRIPATTDYETVRFTSDGTMVNYVGPGSDLNKYYVDRLYICKK